MGKKETIAEFLKGLEGIDQPDVHGVTIESMNEQVEELYKKWDKIFKDLI